MGVILAILTAALLAGSASASPAARTVFLDKFGYAL
jgi:hypothetical protein